MRWSKVCSIRTMVIIILVFAFTLFLFTVYPPDCNSPSPLFGERGSFPVNVQRSGSKIAMNTVSKLGNKTFTRYNPIIFVGGMPRSGTTLMRVILDAHPYVLCGEETRVVPRILQMRQQWSKSKVESTRLHEAGLTDDVLDAATAAFIIEILAKHASQHAKSMLCDKDPFNLKQIVYLKHLFPNSKFLLMIRDGRATAHSIITRKVTISGFDITSYHDVLQKWNRAISEMWKQCEDVGPEFCLPVWYEQLVLQPNRTIRQIVSFLDIPWQDTMLHHQDVVGKNISLSKVERSTDQVVKPVNLDGLNSWVGHIPMNVLSEADTIAPMLLKLGYDPYNYNPKYGEPDEIVKANLKLLEKNPDSFKVDTFRIDRDGSIQKGQPGQNEMAALAAKAKMFQD